MDSFVPATLTPLDVQVSLFFLCGLAQLHKARPAWKQRTVANPTRPPPHSQTNGENSHAAIIIMLGIKLSVNLPNRIPIFVCLQLPGHLNARQEFRVASPSGGMLAKERDCHIKLQTKDTNSLLLPRPPCM